MTLALILWDDQERDIDQMISDAKTYEDNQGMERIPDDSPQILVSSLEMTLTREEDHEQARQDSVQERKDRRVRDLLTSSNRLLASLFAALSLAKRQTVVLQELHSLLLISYRTKTKDYEKGCPLRLGPFHKDVVPILIPSENPEQMPNTLEAIDELIRERGRFVEEIQVLVKNMEARSTIV